MPVNEPKTPKPEDLINEVFSSFMKGFASPAGPKAEEPVVDSVKETHRLLKKAEETGNTLDAALYLDIADRHLRIVELALTYEK